MAVFARTKIVSVAAELMTGCLVTILVGVMKIFIGAETIFIAAQVDLVAVEMIIRTNEIDLA